LFSLVLLANLLFSQVLSASSSDISSNELKTFAYSREWLSLYHYQYSFGKWKSSASEENFFFSKLGSESPLQELKSALAAFKTDESFGHIKLKAQCAFPARFLRIQNRWPKLFAKQRKCPELAAWKEQINLHSLSLLYAGPYPNNPASMFGHTLLRLKRKKGNWLLDYTISFLANVNPADGPISYTFNGIFGGYTGFYHIDPYYINAAQYNNAESREIWEYDLNLTPEEIKFFINHLWEVSLNTGYPYYFLNKNCSYYLLTLLEAVDKRFSVLEGSLLLHPIETIKALKTKKKISYRSSLEKQLRFKINKMEAVEREHFKRSLGGNSKIKNITDPLVLDALIDHMKGLNYSKKAQLSRKDQVFFDEVHERRASVKSSTNYPQLTSKVNPKAIHAPSKLELHKQLGSRDHSVLSYTWGYHSLNDNEEGLTRWSYIDYLKFSIDYSKKNLRLYEVKVLDIMSLSSFSFVLPKLSWRIKASLNRNCLNCHDSLSLQTVGGAGISQHYDRFVLWQFLNFEMNRSSDHTKLFASIELGSKVSIKKHQLSIFAQYYPSDKRGNIVIPLQYNYYLAKNFSLLLDQRYQSRENEMRSSIGIKKHF